MEWINSLNTKMKPNKVISSYLYYSNLCKKLDKKDNKNWWYFRQRDKYEYLVRNL